MIAVTKGFTRWAGLILAVSLPLVSTQAHAVSVTVDDNTYEVGVVTGSFNSNPALQTQPWWTDKDLALKFANALVATNSMTQNIFYYFAYNSNVDFVYAANLGEGGFTGETTVGGDFTTSQDLYATATLSASSVPEINAGSLSQALLMLFALWLVTWRRTASRVA